MTPNQGEPSSCAFDWLGGSCLRHMRSPASQSAPAHIRRLGHAVDAAASGAGRACARMQGSPALPETLNAMVST